MLTSVQLSASKQNLTTKSVKNHLENNHKHTIIDGTCHMCNKYSINIAQYSLNLNHMAINTSVSRKIYGASISIQAVYQHLWRKIAIQNCQSIAPTAMNVTTMAISTYLSYVRYDQLCDCFDINSVRMHSNNLVSINNTLILSILQILFHVTQRSFVVIEMELHFGLNVLIVAM